MSKIEVRDGMFSFSFEGREVAAVSTEKPGRHQWVEMELYWAEPGQIEQSPLLRLPGGGYVTHVIGQSVRAHRHNSSCSSGIETLIKDLIAEALPCPTCRPSFPLMKTMRHERYRDEFEFEMAVSREEGRVYAARSVLTGSVDLESTRHSVHRAFTAKHAVQRIIGDRLSWPAERLLYAAAAADADIKAAIDDPATALAIQEALVASGRVVL